jgi:hypothetical protein
MATIYALLNNSTKTRKTQYNAVYNRLRRNIEIDPTIDTFAFPYTAEQKAFVCLCWTSIAGINMPLKNPSTNKSRSQILSNLLTNYTYYGKVQFVNSSLGTPLYVNYLGRTQGQPGGSGAPPKNRLG